MNFFTIVHDEILDGIYLLKSHQALFGVSEANFGGIIYDILQK